jgi:hypothetical protein
MAKISTKDCTEALCEWMKIHKNEIPIDLSPIASFGKETDGTTNPKHYKRLHVSKQKNKKYRLFMLSGAIYWYDIGFLVVEENDKIIDISWGLWSIKNRRIVQTNTMDIIYHTPYFESNDKKYSIHFKEISLQKTLGIV